MSTFNEINVTLDVCEPTVENTANGGDHMPRTHEVDNDEDEDEAWQQVGPKNHHVETNVVCFQFNCFCNKIII